jgi:DNA-directed RNA polymerase specialized sigma24 family protein
MRPRAGEDRRLPALDASVAGVLALLVDARERWLTQDKAAVKTEVLLAGAGLSLEDIAAVTGKNYNAVRMTIARSREK